MLIVTAVSEDLQLDKSIGTIRMPSSKSRTSFCQKIGFSSCSSHQQMKLKAGHRSTPSRTYLKGPLARPRSHSASQDRENKVWTSKIICLIKRCLLSIQILWIMIKLLNRKSHWPRFHKGLRKVIHWQIRDRSRMFLRVHHIKSTKKTMKLIAVVESTISKNAIIVEGRDHKHLPDQNKQISKEWTMFLLLHILQSNLEEKSRLDSERTIPKVSSASESNSNSHRW